MTSVFQNADKAADLKAVMDVAKATLERMDPELRSWTRVVLQLDLGFQNADKASDLKEVMEVTLDLGAQDATNMTSVFKTQTRLLI